MGETALHHWIFRIITIILIVAGFFANMFSNVIAQWILLLTFVVCAIWLGVNVILLSIRMGRDDFEVRNGFGIEPLFFLIPIAVIQVYLHSMG